MFYELNIAYGKIWRNTAYDRWCKRLWKFLRELHFLEKQGAYVSLPRRILLLFPLTSGGKRSFGTFPVRPRHSSSFFILLIVFVLTSYLTIPHDSGVLLIPLDILSVPSKDYFIYYLFNFVCWFSGETALLTWIPFSLRCQPLAHSLAWLLSW